MPDVLAVGECMVELYAEQPIALTPTFTKAVGGDTLNFVAGMARLGRSAGFVTRVGDDPFTDYLLTTWRTLGVDTAAARRVAGFNAVYFIGTRPDGEHEFTYYRAGSAASTLAPDDVPPALFESVRLLHTSGITQAISPTARAASLAAAQRARAAGALVSFDPNTRLKLWSAAEAHAALADILPYVNIILPSLPADTVPLLGLDERPGAAQRRCDTRRHGAR